MTVAISNQNMLFPLICLEMNQALHIGGNRYVIFSSSSYAKRFPPPLNIICFHGNFVLFMSLKIYMYTLGPPHLGAEPELALHSLYTLFNISVIPNPLTRKFKRYNVRLGRYFVFLHTIYQSASLSFKYKTV